MLQIELADDVARAFPETEVRLVGAYGRRTDAEWAELDEAIRALEAALADATWAPRGEDDPEIASWHTAYRAFGTNPRRMRPSVDALGRRVAKTGTFLRVNPVVDAYNYVSLTSGLPAGAFDARSLDGAVRVRFAVEGDAFTPLGEPEKTEVPKPGEVVYADARRVLTRHWNHRDSDHSKVDDTAVDVILLLERVSADAVGDGVLDDAQKRLSALLAPRFDTVVGATLDAANPAVALPDRARPGPAPSWPTGASGGEGIGATR